MRLTATDLVAESARLVPLIAHDRAGFGGGIATCGVLVLFCVWFGRPSRSLWQALSVSGLAGFGTAIGVLAPAYAGLAIYLAGLGMAIRTGKTARGADGRSGAPGA